MKAWWNKSENENNEVQRLKLALEIADKNLNSANQRAFEAEQRVAEYQASSQKFASLVANLSTFSRSLEMTQSSFAKLAESMGQERQHAVQAQLISQDSRSAIDSIAMNLQTLAGRDQANIMAKFADLPRPVVRCGAGLHRDRTSGQFRKKADDLAARQFPAQDHTSIASGGVNLKHPLCKVQADNANFLHGCSLL